MATTPIGEFIGSDYMGKGSETSTDEAGLLARGYRAASGFLKRHYKVALGAAAGLGMMAAAEGAADADTMVNINWRLAGDNSNINYLDDKTGVTPNSDAYAIPVGDVTDQNSNSIFGQNIRLFFKDGSGQIVGIVPINMSTSDYDFTGTGTAIYGNLPWTPSIDEGILLHEVPGVFAYFIDLDKYFQASIISGRLHTEGFVAEGTDIGVNNVMIDTRVELPDAPTLTLLGAGAAASLFRRRRKFSEVDSDTVKPEEPYYRRFE